MLILVRHGETQANASGLLLGRADPPLTDLGAHQAEQLGRILNPARVIASPLRRAQQTAAAFGVPVETDDNWIEMDYGVLDGADIKTVSPETWKSWRSDPDFAPPGGESLASVMARVSAACQALVDDASTADVVVVSHVSPIKAAMSWSLGSGVELTWRMRLSLASISRIDVSGRSPTLVSFNEVAHLSE